MPCARGGWQLRLHVLHFNHGLHDVSETGFWKDGVPMLGPFELGERKLEVTEAERYN